MKKITAFLLALIMMLSLAACGTKQEPTVSDTPDRGNTTAATENAAPTTDVVRGGSLKIAKTMDMTNNSFAMFHSTYSQADAYVLDQIIETPIKINEDGSFVPSLAESWEFTEDGLGLKLKLRSDVTFSNGTPLTAQGVADLYNYYITEECGHKQKSSDLALVTGTDVVDENTIQINTSSPDAGLLTALSGISFYVYAPENLANDDFATNPIGTGPFVLKEYKEGDHITLARRNDYYLMGEDGQPLPYLDEIYYQILPDDAAKVANLQSGDVDGIDLQSSSNSTITCMANADLSTYQHHYNINFWAGFNFGNEMLAKLEVRQAIAYAIDRQEIVDVVFEGLATTTPFFSRADQYWYLSEFECGGIRFSSMEQYMMYQKANCFGDTKIAEKILQTTDVAQIKDLGRKVSNYNEIIWNGKRQIVVYNGLCAKFQNPKLKSELKATGDAVLAECAVRDCIWGIGLSMTDSKRLEMEKWRGQNLLGFSLMMVRDEV